MTLSPTFKAFCEHIAVTWRRKLGGRRAYDPLPSALLLHELEIAVLTPAQISGLSAAHRQQLEISADWSGAIIALNPIQVLCNPLHSPARHEANMMHECAHIILKHPMIPIVPLSPTPPSDPQYEAEANYLGSCLQIPKRGLLWAVQKGMNTQQIAQHFGASSEMVLFRANMTGQRQKIIKSDERI